MKKQEYLIRFKMLLDSLDSCMEKLSSQTGSATQINKKGYYRNEDLKRLFGLSNNTIIKYRQTGVLPSTRLGDIYLYEIAQIDQILHKNHN